MNKTICIYHSRDLDGWMSAAIVKKWFEGRGVKQQIERFDDSISFKGWDYGDNIPDLKEYDKVTMVDISFPFKNMYSLSKRLDDNFIWIDHHKSSIKENGDISIVGYRDTDFAACELTWMYFFGKKESDKMPEIVRLLGRYDCFGHKGTDEEQKVLEFQYGARACMSNYDECYNELQFECNGISPINGILDNGKAIYKYLCTEAKQTYSKAFNIRFHKHITPSGAVSEIMYSFLCVNQERFNPINFGIDYHKEGYDGFACFWYKDSKWNFSLYNDNNKVDCGVIAKQYGGGGHKGAAGFVVKDLKEVFK